MSQEAPEGHGQYLEDIQKRLTSPEFSEALRFVSRAVIMQVHLSLQQAQGACMLASIDQMTVSPSTLELREALLSYYTRVGELLSGRIGPEQ